MDYDDGYMCAECPSGFTGGTVRGYDLQDAENLRQVCYIWNPLTCILLILVWQLYQCQI